MKKFFTSLIALMLLVAGLSTITWANSVALGPPNSSWLQTIAINNNGTGSSSWNQFQMQFQGFSFLAGISWNGGSWTFSASNHQLVGSTSGNWNSTLYLTLGLLPTGPAPFAINVFQFNKGTLLAGATTTLTWDGKTWSAVSSPGLTPVPVPEPSVLTLLGITALLGGALNKRPV